MNTHGRQGDVKYGTDHPNAGDAECKCIGAKHPFPVARDLPASDGHERSTDGDEQESGDYRDCQRLGWPCERNGKAEVQRWHGGCDERT